MTGTLGPVTATFSVHSEAGNGVDEQVRVLLAARYLDAARLRSRVFGGQQLLVVEQPAINEAEAEAVLGEIRALATVRSAELECRLERRPARAKLLLSVEPARIDVV